RITPSTTRSPEQPRNVQPAEVDAVTISLPPAWTVQLWYAFVVPAVRWKVAPFTTSRSSPAEGGQGAWAATVTAALALTDVPPFDAVNVKVVAAETGTVVDVLPVTSPTPRSISRRVALDTAHASVTLPPP